MLQGLSLLPSLAVAGVTTSVSLVTAMGGVQSLPQAPANPPVVAMAAVQGISVEAPGRMSARVLAEPSDTTIGAVAVATPVPAPVPAPTSAPPAPVVAAPAATARPAPAPTPAPARISTPAPTPAPQCTTWLYQGWTVTWCATATTYVYDWTATSGSTTYSGTYNTATGAVTGTYPSTWSSSWATTGSNPSHGHH
ncbi:MAG TPA: hypothetical protein VFC09_03505 [Candidatus Dormibacteraeota bacterium]|nr:hypothetical protein [Candidatus Dormibacteraeota bacterium]